MLWSAIRNSWMMPPRGRKVNEERSVIFLSFFSIVLIQYVY